MAVSAVLAFAPEYDGLSGAGRRGLYILLSSAGLWITEAIPPFAVGLQLIGLAIALLGRPGGVFASGPDDWEIFSASAAMCLPVSTPPNALAFGSGLLDSRDFLPIGLIFGAVAPAASVLWSGFVLG